MPGFLDRLVVSPGEDGIHWTLVEPFDYWTGEAGNRIQITVPAGFLTDFGSIPQIFQNIVSSIGKPTKAFVLHDWLYHTQQFSRERSDQILFEAMGLLGVSELEKLTIYEAVRLGGWFPWDAHAAENAKKDKS